MSRELVQSEGSAYVVAAKTRFNPLTLAKSLSLELYWWFLKLVQ
jgi:hypothetical protein